jgi:hypothetical protein
MASVRMFAPPIVAALVTAGVMAGGAVALDDRGDTREANPGLR